MPTRRPPTDKRARFAAEYAKDFNATQAAIRSGYAKKGAHVTASRLLADPRVAAMVQAILGRVAAKTEITVERTMQEIARIAYSDPRKLYDAKGKLKAVHTLDERHRRDHCGRRTRGQGFEGAPPG